jgi:hypothetical protein
MKTPRKSKAIRDSARGEACTMQTPYCNHDSNTTVWCHSNKQYHGKGAGLKAYDIFGFYGCSSCHDWFDKDTTVSWSQKASWYALANARSAIILLEKGLLTMKGAK